MSNQNQSANGVGQVVFTPKERREPSSSVFLVRKMDGNPNYNNVHRHDIVIGIFSFTPGVDSINAIHGEEGDLLCTLFGNSVRIGNRWEGFDTEDKSDLSWYLETVDYYKEEPNQAKVLLMAMEPKEMKTIDTSLLEDSKTVIAAVPQETVDSYEAIKTLTLDQTEMIGEVIREYGTGYMVKSIVLDQEIKNWLFDWIETSYRVLPEAREALDDILLGYDNDSFDLHQAQNIVRFLQARIAHCNKVLATIESYPDEIQYEENCGHYNYKGVSITDTSLFLHHDSRHKYLRYNESTMTCMLAVLSQIQSALSGLDKEFKSRTQAI